MGFCLGVYLVGVLLSAGVDFYYFEAWRGRISGLKSIGYALAWPVAVLVFIVCVLIEFFARGKVAFLKRKIKRRL